MLTDSGCLFYTESSQSSAESAALGQKLYDFERYTSGESIFKPDPVADARAVVILQSHFRKTEINETNIPNWLRLQLQTMYVSWSQTFSFAWDDKESVAPILRPVCEKSVGSKDAGYQSHNRYTRVDRSICVRVTLPPGMRNRAGLHMSHYVHPFVLMERKMPFNKLVSDNCRASLCNFIAREASLEALPYLHTAVRDCATLLWEFDALRPRILQVVKKKPDVVDKGCRTILDICTAVRECVRYVFQLYLRDVGGSATAAFRLMRRRAAPTTVAEAGAYFDALVQCRSRHEYGARVLAEKIQWDVLYTSSDGRKLVVEALAAFAMLQLTAPPKRQRMQLLSLVVVGAVGCLQFHEFDIPTGQMSTFVRPDLRLIPLWNARSSSTRAMQCIVDHFASFMFAEANDEKQLMMPRLENRLPKIGFYLKDDAAPAEAPDDLPADLKKAVTVNADLTPVKKPQPFVTNFVFMPESWPALTSKMTRRPFPSYVPNTFVKTCEQSAETVIYKKLLESHAQFTGLLKPISIEGCELVLPFVSDMQFTFSQQESCDGTMLHHWLCVVEALQTIHSLGYAHRDIASRNVLRGKTQSFLIDFGEALPLTSELRQADVQALLYLLLISIHVPDAFCVVHGLYEHSHIDFVAHIKKLVGLELADELIEVLSSMIRGAADLVDVTSRFKMMLNARRTLSH
eukprot:TRINITY_DN1666_c0_g2_i4.p1 TRINITY_DN1666_c0_g2~~TRINITY_DN1666_c0_g2_i4.p1  ORF type:complete len:686 (+),score=97.80 TRINITY_DN1666_c0_g2_i4:133-2190(+)